MTLPPVAVNLRQRKRVHGDLGAMERSHGRDPQV